MFINDLAFVMPQSSTIVSQGAVVRKSTIANPCRIDPTSRGAVQYLPFKDQIQQTLSAAASTDRECYTLKSLLMKVLLRDELSTDAHNDMGLPSGASDDVLTKDNIMNILHQDYRDVSIYIMYLEYFQKVFTNLHATKFHPEIEAVLTQLYTWLCTINTILRSHNSTVTEFVGYSVVHTDLLKYVEKDSKCLYRLTYAFLTHASDFITKKRNKLTKFIETIP